MNKHLLLPGIFALCLSACGPVYVVHQDPPPPPPPAAMAPAPAPEDLTYQNFYDQLSPYGQWIENPEYGYVWMPDAGPDFKPYGSNGHWVYTDEGWAWDSGYPWGWATFHYGRWFFQDGYGWMWIPGNEWAPAWVEWRNSDEYYGWAPLGPNVSFGVAYGGGYTPPAHYWCFVPHQYVASPQIHNYYVHETNNVTIINRTTIINNTTIVNRGGGGGRRWGGGPDANDVGRYSGASVRPISIHDGRTPGERANGNDYVVYRPRVNGAPANDNRPGIARPAPSRVATLDNARPVNHNSYGNGNNGWRNNGNNGNGNGNNGNGNGNGNGNNGNGNNGNGWNGNNPTRTSPGYSTNPNQPGGTSQPYNRPVNGNDRPTFNDRPLNNQPVNNQPLNNQPVNNQPVYNQPANNQPVNSQPTNNRPFNFPRPGGQPANNQPVNNQPVNNQPVNNQPVNSQPVNNQPTNNRPINYQRPGSQPANNLPANNPAAGQSQQTQSRPAMPMGRPYQQPTNNPQAKPVANSPKAAPSQRIVAPPQKRDDSRKDNRQ